MDYVDDIEDNNDDVDIDIDIDNDDVDIDIDVDNDDVDIDIDVDDEDDVDIDVDIYENDDYVDDYIDVDDDDYINIDDDDIDNNYSMKSHPYHLYTLEWAVPSSIVNSYDQKLYKLVDKIFRERCHSSSHQFKQFLCSLPQDYNIDQNSDIKLILEEETILTGQLPSGELGKIPLLWIAVLANYQNSFELLVRCGADVNQLFGYNTDEFADDYSTILHILLRIKPTPAKERLINLVVDNGADLEARDRRNRTPLHIAAKNGRVQMTKLLLEKGVAVNVVDHCLQTPLLVALRSSKADELLPLLINYGADVTAKSASNSNALHFLADIRKPHAAQADVAKVLIEKGVSVTDERGLSKEQPLHLAVHCGNNELVNLFLEYGANVDAQTSYRKTPIHLAVQKNDAELLKSLLKGGPNVNLQNNAGSTPLHLACREAMNGSREVITLLLSAGADVLIEDCNSKTPFAILNSDNIDPDDSMDRINMHNPSFKLMIKALALKKVCQPAIMLNDVNIIWRYSKMRDYFRNCIEELNRMKTARFVDTCTLFELLIKSKCEIARFIQREEFESRFNLYHLDRFFIYAEDIRQAFEVAHQHYKAKLEYEEAINEAIHYRLPYLIVRKMVRHIFNNCCS